MRPELDSLRAVMVSLPWSDLAELRRVVGSRDDDTTVAGLITMLVHQGVNKLRETAT